MAIDCKNNKVFLSADIVAQYRAVFTVLIGKTASAQTKKRTLDKEVTILTDGG